MLAANLGFLIKHSEYSQNQIAKKLGIDSRNLRDLRDGKTLNPRLDTILKIADFFNITCTELVQQDLTK